MIGKKIQWGERRPLLVDINAAVAVFEEKLFTFSSVESVGTLDSPYPSIWMEYGGAEGAQYEWTGVFVQIIDVIEKFQEEAIEKNLALSYLNSIGYDVEDFIYTTSLDQERVPKKATKLFYAELYGLEGEALESQAYFAGYLSERYCLSMHALGIQVKTPIEGGDESLDAGTYLFYLFPALLALNMLASRTGTLVSTKSTVGWALIPGRGIH